MSESSGDYNVSENSGDDNLRGPPYPRCSPRYKYSESCKEWCDSTDGSWLIPPVTLSDRLLGLEKVISDATKVQRQLDNDFKEHMFGRDAGLRDSLTESNQPALERVRDRLCTFRGLHTGSRPPNPLGPAPKQAPSPNPPCSVLPHEPTAPNEGSSELDQNPSGGKIMSAAPASDYELQGRHIQQYPNIQVSTPEPGAFNGFKLRMERIFHTRIDWWPLSEAIGPDAKRISFKCVCFF